MAGRAQAPAAGERRALGGYHPQYRLAAGLILRALREGALEWARLADPEAGRLDDVQIGTPGRVDAYQVKWSRDATTFTLNRLITPPDETTPSLIAQLADGWHRLRATHAGRQVVVHLTTNDYPSTHDRIEGTAAGGGPVHFAAFVAECWEPIASAAPGHDPDVPARWRAAWTKLVTASGLGEDAFRVFARDCRLEFRAVRPDEVVDLSSASTSASAAREARAWREDFNALTLTLYDLVTGRAQEVEFSRGRLLQVLGWEDRAEFRSRHEFPEPDIPYREVAVTVRGLADALSASRGGYLILLGTPGSGKSTLLTQTLRYQPERVIRYYAYVPDSLEPNAHRGEAVNFLHDLTVSLDRAGFAVGGTLPRDDERLLSARVHEQLRKLHERYAETGERTVVLIDGLDHIVREQAPSRPLLSVLPDPSAIPEGVYFVLGSQTDQLPGLPAAVRTQLGEPARRLEMQPLPRSAVIAIVDESGLPVPTSDEVERIVSLVGGHPLALAYVINKLRGGLDRPVTAVLDEITPFRNRIDEQYEAHWYAVEGNRALVHLLSLLARVRGGIERGWVEAWANRDALYALRRFEHYFRREPSGRWFFFHNSFRAFLLAKTRELPGVAWPGGDAGLYRELADHCAAAADGSPLRWDELYYRGAAGEHDAVLALAQPAAFRAQFFAGRPAHLILADVRRAVRSVTARRDAVALARVALIGFEIARRDDNLPDAEVTELLLALGDVRTAVDRLHDGNQLHVGTVVALQASATIDDAGLHEDAERVFALAEPLEVLASPSPPRPHEAQRAEELLNAWVEVAPRFRQVNKLLAIIGRLRRTDDPAQRRSADELTRDRRSDLRFRLAVALRSLDRWDDALSVIGTWSPASGDDWPWWFWSHVHAWRRAMQVGEHDRAATMLNAAQAATEGHVLNVHERVALAEGTLTVHANADQARVFLEGVAQPALVDLLSTRSEAGFAPFEARFRLNRVLAALGDERSLIDLIPAPADPQHGGLVLFERMVVQVARLWGAAWAGHRLAPASFVSDAHGVLRLFARRQDVAWRGWYLAQGARAELYALLVRAAALHGDDVVDALRGAFEREWREPELLPYWPAEVIRSVLTALAQSGAPRTWVAAWLEAIAPRTLEDEDHETRLKHAVAQCHALIGVGDPTGARALYGTLLDATLAVGYKDPQFESWIEWAERANAEDPSGAAERLGKLASILPWLDETTERTGYAPAPLLRAACGYAIESGAALLEWYLERGLMHFTTGLEILLSAVIERGGAGAAVAAAAVHRHLLLPLDTSASPEVMRGTVLAAVEHTRMQNAAPGAASDAIRHVLDGVDVAALPSTRSVLRAVAGEVARQIGASGVDVGAAAARAGADEEGSEDDLAQHLTGEALSLDEARWRATSADAIRELLSREKPHSYLRWERVIDGFVAQATRAEVLSVADVFVKVARPDRRTAVDVLLSNRLLELGDRDSAFALAERALDAAPEYGWQERYDGGSKLRALHSMARIDRDRARERAWNTLAEDLASGRTSLAAIATDLPPVLPLLVDQVPTPAVWAHVDSYLKQLLAHARVVEPPVLRGPTGAQPAEVLLTFAARYLEHPAYVLSTGAQRTLVDGLLGADENARRVITALLEDRAGPHQPVMAVLAAVAEIAPEVARSVRAAVEPLSTSPHFGVREAARGLLDTVCVRSSSGSGARTESEDAAARAAAKRALPPVYGLALQPRGPVHRLREVRSGELLPTTTDPADIIRVVRDELNVVARLADVQPEALYYRVVQIMDELSGGTFVDTEAELQKQFEGMGLRKALYRRPRSQLVRRAMLHAVAELVDAGQVKAGDVVRLEGLMRDGDPTMLRVRPHARPACIVPISERGVREYVEKDWTSRASVAPSALNADRSAVGGVVLAEETHLRWLDWETPTEVRVGARTVGEPPDTVLRGADDLMAALCEVWSHVRVADYLTHEPESDVPVVLQHGYQFDTPGRRWLALNPAVGRELGWKPAARGLFRWVDSAGRAMAESVWWEDGNPELWPPQFHDEVGCGWLVRLSALGWEQLSGARRSLVDCIRVRRTAGEQEPRYAVAQRRSA